MRASVLSSSNSNNNNDDDDDDEDDDDDDENKARRLRACWLAILYSTHSARPIPATDAVK